VGIYLRWLLIRIQRFASDAIFLPSGCKNFELRLLLYGCKVKGVVLSSSNEGIVDMGDSAYISGEMFSKYLGDCKSVVIVVSRTSRK